jgi:hypothetical protein
VNVSCTHACNSNQLIILASKEGNLPGCAVAGGEVEGDGWALLTVVNPTCCSQWSWAAIAKEIFQTVAALENEDDGDGGLQNKRIK